MDTTHLTAVGLVPKVEGQMPLDFEFVVSARHAASDEAIEYREHFSRRDLVQRIVEAPDMFRLKFGHHGFQLAIELLGREMRDNPA